MMTAVVAAALVLASSAHHVPYQLLEAVAMVESNLDPLAYRYNDGGTPSIGLGQVKRATCSSLGVTVTHRQLFDPYTNADCMARYLQYQYKRYKSWDKAILAYNAGSAHGRNKDYLIRVLLYASGIK